MRKNLIFISALLTGCADNYNDIIQKDMDEHLSKEYKSPIPIEDLKEFPKGRNLMVVGKLPNWLSGVYFRTGPGKFNFGKEDNQSSSHFFDGHAFFTSFNIKSGTIDYHSSMAKTDQYLESVATGKNMLWGVQTAVSTDSIEKRVSRDGQKVMTTNPAVNVVQVGPYFATLGETLLPVTVDPITTETKGVLDYDDEHLKVKKAWESAHPKIDPDSGTLYGMFIEYGLTSDYNVYKINAGSSKREIISKISVKCPGYMHDMSITKNYVVLVESPITVNPMTLLTEKYGFLGAHRWEPNKKTNVYVISKKTGEIVKKVEVDPFFTWHHFNAFENKDGKINIFVRWYDDARAAILVPSATITDKKYNTKAHFVRLEVDIQKEDAKKHIISDIVFEFATVPDHLVGKENRYFYGVIFVQEEAGIAKYDLKTNTYISWNLKNGICGEPRFVPNPNATSEDDGVVMTIAYDPSLRKSFFVVLDAKTLKEIARAEAPQIIPKGLHGAFFPTKTLTK